MTEMKQIMELLKPSEGPPNIMVFYHDGQIKRYTSSEFTFRDDVLDIMDEDGIGEMHILGLNGVAGFLIRG